jgi:hypothetical protein
LTQTLNVDFRLFAIEIKWIATGEIQMEEATGWWQPLLHLSACSAQAALFVK